MAEAAEEMVGEVLVCTAQDCQVCLGQRELAVLLEQLARGDADCEGDDGEAGPDAMGSRGIF